MATNKLNYEEIQKLIEVAEKYGLRELTVSEGGMTVTLRSKGHGPQASVALEPSAEPFASAQPASRPARKTRKKPEETQAVKGVPLLSPMTGVFYRAPSPDEPSFVEVGDRVEVGQTIGLIEAMKVFSEVPAEIAGTVVGIVATNGKLVMADEPLILVEPDE